MSKWNKFVKEELEKDEEFKEEYEKMKGWYNLKRDLILAREKANLTQTELAAKMGMKQSNISRFENLGLNSKIDTLIKYAKALGLKELKISIQ